MLMLKNLIKKKNDRLLNSKFQKMFIKVVVIIHQLQERESARCHCYDNIL